MIDEKRIAEIELGMEDVLALTQNKNRYSLTLNYEDTKELIHLARLGLWAEKYGVPFVHYSGAWTSGDFLVRTQEALSALPGKKDV